MPNILGHQAQTPQVPTKITEEPNSEEVAEYSYYVDVDDVIALLKAKARHLVGREAS